MSDASQAAARQQDSRYRHREGEGDCEEVLLAVQQQQGSDLLCDPQLSSRCVGRGDHAEQDDSHQEEGEDREAHREMRERESERSEGRGGLLAERETGSDDQECGVRSFL